ncbi:MAG: DUF4159 domain-containing protein [Longimicrobiales bacterium]|nr:DUF4159 domain-containing protein [Longimicrobiales bacterium]
MTPLRLIMLGLLAGTSMTLGAAVYSLDGGQPATIDYASNLLGDAAPQNTGAPYDGQYHFVRIAYQSGRGGGGFGRRGGRGGASWAHDYPRADQNFLAILQETTLIRTTRASSNVITLADPELFRFPIAYIVEPGRWNPSATEVEALGDYLLKGGFLIVDDFRGPRELDNLEFYLRQALPDHRMMPVENSDEIFDSFFRVVPQDVVPPYGGYPPFWYGIYEDNDPSKRLMVVINANNDMAEYWEYSDYGYVQIDLTNEAYKLGVNYIAYALTH